MSDWGSGHEVEREIRPLHLGHRLGDHPCVVFGEPVLEERVRHPCGDRQPVLRDETGGPEPGVEAVAVYLRLDAGRGCRPRRSLHDAFARQEIAIFQAFLAGDGQKSRYFGPESVTSRATSRFSTAFPQVWKTLGRDQTCMDLLRRKCSGKGRRL